MEYFEETYRDPQGHEEIEQYGLGKVQTSGAQVRFVGTVQELEEALSEL